MDKISFQPKRILKWLIIIAIVQFITYIAVAALKPEAVVVEGIWGLFNMDRELSIPTWYSQFLFLLPATLMAWLAYTTEQKKNRVYWGLLSSLMVFLSMDDGAAIHERFSIIYNQLGLDRIEGVFFYSWTAVAIPLVLIVVLLFFKFFLSLPSRTRWLVVAAGTLFLSGALGVEMFTSYTVSVVGRDVSPLVIGLEETLELIGVSILAYALLDHIEHLPPQKRSLTIKVSS